MCVMSATFSFGKARNTFGMLMIKYTAENGLFMNLAKTNWKLRTNQKVPITFTFDDRTDAVWNSNANVAKPDILESSFPADVAAAFIDDFRYSDKMVVSFKYGKEQTWTANMNGSRKAAKAFLGCVAEIDETLTATQPDTAPSQPDAERNPWPLPRELTLSTDKFRGA
jgi:hypothetical protein